MTWEGLNPPYSTIVADPPWHYDDAPMGDFRGGRLARFLPYPTMPITDIELLAPVDLAAPGAHLYLWTTQRYLWDAKAIAEAWGWKVLQVLTWCKPPLGMGGGGAFANTTEFVLFCRLPVGALIRKAREAAGLGRADVHRLVRGGTPTGIVFRWEANDCYPTHEDWAGLADILGLPLGLAADPVRTNSTWWTWRRGTHSEKPSAFLDIVEQVSPGPYVELFARAPRLGWDSWGKGYESGVAS